MRSESLCTCDGCPPKQTIQPLYPASEADEKSESDMEDFIVPDDASESGDDDSESASESDDGRRGKKSKRRGSKDKRRDDSDPLQYLNRRVKARVGKQWRTGTVRL